MIRRRGNRCVVCGGSTFVDVTDNHGNKYPGCARCRIVRIDDTPEFFAWATDMLRRGAKP